jgi:hypothetical protein
MRTATRAGFALAVTLGTGYALCTLVFVLWPEHAANFMNALFHGLDFRRLRHGPEFDFGRFVYVQVVLMVGAFWAGALFGALFDRLGREPSASAAPRS